MKNTTGLYKHQRDNRGKRRKVPAGNQTTKLVSVTRYDYEAARDADREMFGPDAEYLDNAGERERVIEECAALVIALGHCKDPEYVAERIRTLSHPAPDTVRVPVEPTEEMIDAPRQIILYAETPGRTLEGLRAHLVRSGVDYLAWFPVWATRDTGHLTKAAIATLVYMTMLSAAQSAKQRGGWS